MSKRKDEAQCEDFISRPAGNPTEGETALMFVLGTVMVILLAIIAIAASNGEVIAWLR